MLFNVTSRARHTDLEQTFAFGVDDLDGLHHSTRLSFVMGRMPPTHTVTSVVTERADGTNNVGPDTTAD